MFQQMWNNLEHARAMTSYFGGSVTDLEKFSRSVTTDQILKFNLMGGRVQDIIAGRGNLAHNAVQLGN